MQLRNDAISLIANLSGYFKSNSCRIQLHQTDRITIDSDRVKTTYRSCRKCRTISIITSYMSIIIDILDLCRIRIFIILLNFGRNISRVNQEVASLSLCVECLRRDIIQRHSLIECHTSCIQPHSQRILSINITLQDGLTLSLQRRKTIFLVSDHFVIILHRGDLYVTDSRSAISRSFLRSELEDYILIIAKSRLG